MSFMQILTSRGGGPSSRLCSLASSVGEVAPASIPLSQYNATKVPQTVYSHKINALKAETKTGEISCIIIAWTHL